GDQPRDGSVAHRACADQAPVAFARAACRLGGAARRSRPRHSRLAHAKPIWHLPDARAREIWQLPDAGRRSRTYNWYQADAKRVSDANSGGPEGNSRASRANCSIVIVVIYAVCLAALGAGLALVGLRCLSRLRERTRVALEHLVHAEERERRKLAYDIHDTIAQTTAGVRLSLEAFAEAHAAELE